MHNDETAHSSSITATEAAPQPVAEVLPAATATIAPAPALSGTAPQAGAQPTGNQLLLPPGVTAESVIAEFTQMLHDLAVDGVSDIHFIGNDVAWPVRFGRPVKSQHRITNNQILCWAEVFGKSKGGAAELQNGAAGSMNCMAVIGPVGAQVRLRMTFRRQSSGLGMTFRIVSENPPQLTDSLFHLNPVPAALVDMTLNFPSGLVLFCGPTGSGKTTMNAALLNEVNSNQNKHIYTIEDPIEFVHKSQMSIVTQREIGEHASTFAQGLKDSLRSLPNIILVGELLDLETVRVAIEAANKGHLVFATSHASSAEEAVSSLVSQFPGSEQNQVSTAVAQALKAVVVQRLVPTIDGRVVPAREFLINNTAMAAKIREKLFNQITQQLNPRDGMWKFEDDLVWLWANGIITEDAAFKACNSIGDLTKKFDYAKANKEDVALGRHHNAGQATG